MNAYSLLIDLGGTDVKVGVSRNGSLNSNSIHRKRMPKFKDEKLKTYDPQGILNIVRDLIDLTVAEHGLPNVVLISGQTGSWILTDESGLPLTDVISWQAQSNESRDKLFSAYGENYDISKDSLNGNGHEDWSGAPWRNLVNYLEGLNLEVRPPLFHTLVSWTVWELTGQMNHYCHITDAAATGMMNIYNYEWLSDFQNFSVAPKMPEIVHGFTPAGNLTNTTVPMIVGLADQQTSLLGVGLRRGAFVINAGTGGQVAKILDTLDSGVFKVRPYFFGEMIETITHIPSGRFLEKLLFWLNRQTNDKYSWEWLACQGVEVESLEIDSVDFNWDIDGFTSEGSKFGSAELFAGYVVSQISTGFVKKLIQLGCKKGDNVYLAGGVATSLKSLKAKLEDLELNTVETETSETTLEGLNKITKMLKA